VGASDDEVASHGKPPCGPVRIAQCLNHPPFL
jgi:hypothetical protein